METGLDQILDGFAEGKLTVVVGVEISTYDPTDDFFTSELFGHFIFVGDDLTNLFGACSGDVFGSIRSFTSTVAAQVNAINHN